MIQILAKDSPELFELLEDYREKLTGVIESQPLLEMARSHDALLSTRVGVCCIGVFSVEIAFLLFFVDKRMA